MSDGCKACQYRGNWESCTLANCDLRECWAFQKLTDDNVEISGYYAEELQKLEDQIAAANERAEKAEHSLFTASDQITGKDAEIARLRAAWSMTHGEMPEILRDMIHDHEWDNKNISEQRDWAVSQLARLKADISKLEDAPLCADHAQTWFTARNELHPKSGCIFCDLVGRGKGGEQ